MNMIKKMIIFGVVALISSTGLMQAGSVYKFRNIGPNPIAINILYSAIDSGKTFKREFILRQNSDVAIETDINCCLNCVTAEINDITTELVTSWKTCTNESKPTTEECIVNAEAYVAAISGECGLIWVNLAARIKVMEDLMRWARGMFPGLPDKPYVTLTHPERAAYAQIPNLRDYMGQEVMKYEQQWNNSMASCGYPHYSQIFNEGVSQDDIDKLSKFWTQKGVSLLVKWNANSIQQSEPSPAPAVAVTPTPAPVIIPEAKNDADSVKKTKKRKTKKAGKKKKREKKKKKKKKKKRAPAKREKRENKFTRR